MGGGEVSWSNRKIICHEIIKAWTTTESIMRDSREDTEENFRKRSYRGS